MKNIGVWKRKNYVIGTLVLGVFFSLVSWLTLAIREYAKEPYNEQKRKEAFGLILPRFVFSTFPMMALFIVNFVFSTKELKYANQLAFGSPIESFLEGFKRPLEECFEPEQVSFNSQLAIENWNKEPSQILPLRMIAIYTAILALEIVSIVFKVMHIIETFRHMMAKEQR